MDTQFLLNLGIPKAAHKAIYAVIRYVHRQGGSETQMYTEVQNTLHGLSSPDSELARLQEDFRNTMNTLSLAVDVQLKSTPVEHPIWGAEGICENAKRQMDFACSLPIAHKGALMPDAHLGYGLPIGGVLATKNAVIPYAVGVDISCSMMLTVYDFEGSKFDLIRDRIRKAMIEETRFGVGCSFDKGLRHDPMLENPLWNQIEILKRNHEKARQQIGTSGSGNHFVDFGLVTLGTDKPLLAVMSHSGSRGTGAAVCGYYHDKAKEYVSKNNPGISKDVLNLAWLDMNSQEGQEYWAAMNLMYEYATANHRLIHHHLSNHLFGENPPIVMQITNSHNLAWKESHNGEELIVHRKGATPAGKGVMGIIPGSMATPGFLVEGLGNPDSLCSASHGAGRAMSRNEAHKAFNWTDVNKTLTNNGVELISGGLDETPGSYKNIHDVICAQYDLVKIVGMFEPKMVLMAGAGEKPED